MLTAVFVTAVTVMMMSVVIAVRVGVKLQISFGKRFCRFVRRAPDSCIEFDSGLRECRLRTHTDPAANQRIGFCRLQETGQCAVPAPVGIYDLLIYDLAILNVV